jgi:hypothetical protein
LQESDAMMDALQTIRRTSQFLTGVSAVAALVMAYEAYAAIAEYLTPPETGWEAQGLRLTSVAFVLGFGWLAYLVFRYSLDVGKLCEDESATLERVVLLQKKLWHGVGVAAAISLLTGLVVVVYFFLMNG